MKSVFVMLLLVASFSVSFGVSLEASASPRTIRQCTRTLNDMTDLINDYIVALKTCRQYPRGSSFHTQAENIAREVEALYPKYVDRCLQVCAGTSAEDSCRYTVSGACP